MNDRLVYSTESGNICSKCENPISRCACKENERMRILGDGNVKLRRETKGRNGKAVTIISGLPLHKEGLSQLLTKLKKLCGAGGALKDGNIEIQGEHIDKLREELRKLGYKPKG